MRLVSQAMSSDLCFSTITLTTDVPHRNGEYALVIRAVVDPTGDSEDGKIDLKVMTAGSADQSGSNHVSKRHAWRRQLLQTDSAGTAVDWNSNGTVAWDTLHLQVQPRLTAQQGLSELGPVDGSIAF